MEIDMRDMWSMTELSMALCYAVEAERGILESPDYVVIKDEKIPKKIFFTPSGALPAISSMTDVTYMMLTDKPLLGAVFRKNDDVIAGLSFTGNIRKNDDAWVRYALPMRKVMSDMSVKTVGDESLDFTGGLSIVRMLCDNMKEHLFTSVDMHAYLQQNISMCLNDIIGVSQQGQSLEV